MRRCLEGFIFKLRAISFSVVLKGDTCLPASIICRTELRYCDSSWPTPMKKLHANLIGNAITTGMESMAVAHSNPETSNSAAISRSECASFTYGLNGLLNNYHNVKFIDHQFHPSIMARIAATDGLSAEAIALLERRGHEVVTEFYDTAELESGVLNDFDAVIVRSATKITADVVSSSPNLKVIARAGVGVDNIDLETAGRAGIPVVNAPIASTQSVVELTIAHLLACVRNVPKSDRSMRSGMWEKKAMKGSELSGKNLGLVGFGRIAQSVGAVAQSLGMTVHAYDPYLPPKIAKNHNTRLHKSVNTLFSNCSHISIHCNLTDETHHLVNYEMMKKMPGKSSDGISCGNHIVNCARGGIVNEDDLLQALNEGILASAALDVFEIEPVADDYELCKHPNFHGTPHIGASTIEAQRRVGLDIAKNVMAVLGNKKCEFIVNKPYLK